MNALAIVCGDTVASVPAAVPFTPPAAANNEFCTWCFNDLRYAFTDVDKEDGECCAPLSPPLTEPAPENVGERSGFVASKSLGERCCCKAGGERPGSGGSASRFVSKNDRLSMDVRGGGDVYLDKDSASESVTESESGLMRLSFRHCTTALLHSS